MKKAFLGVCISVYLKGFMIDKYLSNDTKAKFNTDVEQHIMSTINQK